MTFWPPTPHPCRALLRPQEVFGAEQHACAQPAGAARGVAAEAGGRGRRPPRGAVCQEVMGAGAGLSWRDLERLCLLHAVSARIAAAHQGLAAGAPLWQIWQQRLALRSSFAHRAKARNCLPVLPWNGAADPIILLSFWKPCDKNAAPGAALGRQRRQHRFLTEEGLRSHFLFLNRSSCFDERMASDPQP